MSDNLQSAIDLLNAGKKGDAGPVFARIVKEDPNNERAWLGLSACVKDEGQKKYCLNQVLRINPQNVAARRLIEGPDIDDWAKMAPSRGNTSSGSVDRNYASPILPSHPAGRKKRWYRESWLAIVCFLFFFPGFLLLVLTDKRQGTLAKVAVVLIQIIMCGAGFYLLPGGISRLASLDNEFPTLAAPSSVGVSNDLPTLAVPTPYGATTGVNDFTVLPVGSNLTDKNWSYHVDRIATKTIIQWNGEINYPKNGRFAILYLSGTNTDYSPNFFMAPIESGIIDSEGSAFQVNLPVSTTETFAENLEVGLQVNPRETGKVLAVYDISSTSKAYCLVVGYGKTCVLLDMPTP